MRSARASFAFTLFLFLPCQQLHLNSWGVHLSLSSAYSAWTGPTGSKDGWLNAGDARWSFFSWPLFVNPPRLSYRLRCFHHPRRCRTSWCSPCDRWQQLLKRVRFCLKKSEKGAVGKIQKDWENNCWDVAYLHFIRSQWRRLDQFLNHSRRLPGQVDYHWIDVG